MKFVKFIRIFIIIGLLINLFNGIFFLNSNDDFKLFGISGMSKEFFILINICLILSFIYILRAKKNKLDDRN